MEVVYVLLVEVRFFRVCVGRIQDQVHIDLRRAVCDQIGPLLQAVGPADHLIHGAESEPCHNLTKLPCDKNHEVHDIFRLAREALSELLVLCGHAGRTGVLGADSHHHAAHADQRCCRKAVFLCAEQGGDRDIAAAHQLSVSLDDDTVSQTVLKQGLMRLGDAELPRQASVMDRGDRRSAGSSVVSGNQDDLSTRLGYTGSNRSDAALGYQLDGDPRVPVGVLQIIDQLSQILDGVNIMVRRRRDQSYARG